MRQRVIIIGLLLTLSACGEAEVKKPTRNVIKEYVNTPKEKARDVASSLEDAQEKTHQQFKDLVEDE